MYNGQTTVYTWSLSSVSNYNVTATLTEGTLTTFTLTLDSGIPDLPPDVPSLKK